MPATCIPPTRWGASDTSPRLPRGHYLGRVLASAAAMSGGRLGRDLCGFKAPTAALAAAVAAGSGGFVQIVAGAGAEPYPPETPFACASIVANGGEGGGSYFIDLGLDAGTVTLNFNAYAVPDRFTVILGGVTVIDTGWRGEEASPSDEWYGLMLSGPGGGSASFVKAAGSPRYAQVNVEAPYFGTAWDFSLSCPAP